MLGVGFLFSGENFTLTAVQLHTLVLIEVGWVVTADVDDLKDLP